MDNVSKDVVADVEIYDYTGESYRTVMRYDAWRVAYLNHGAYFEEENFERVERHMQSDEVFVLLEGEATLIIGEELNKIEMKLHKVYNVPKGVWHHIFTKEGARVLIVENEDTGEKNTEYLPVEKP